MKNYKVETEFDSQTEALLESICGRGDSNFSDDFGIDDSWLESFIEDYNIGG
jgi:hypothetical protein